MIYDIFTFNGEFDLLEIRLNILDEFVDEFIICEAPTTFSGKPKPLYFGEFLEGIKHGRYNIKPRVLDKIKYFVIDENYTEEEIELAENSPNTQGAEHWKHEFLQKESIKKALTHLKDDDICFIGDVDEIWRMPKVNGVYKLRLEVYTYYLNNLSTEKFWGTIVGRYGDIKDKCLNHLRVEADKTLADYGWHFTSMGGLDEVRRKLSDSYTEESYWNPVVQNRLEINFKNNKDFLGRDFEFIIDETNLPKYIISNKKRYEHLFR